MKKKWLSLFIFCVMCLFCLNVKASAATEIRSQVKSGKTTYYVLDNNTKKIYKKESGKSKAIVKVSAKESISKLICVYKNDLYYIVENTEGEDYVKLVKYGIKSKKKTTIKKVNAYSPEVLYSNGSIYIHYCGKKYINAIYTYNCKKKTYKKFATIELDVDSTGSLLGIYGDYIYYYKEYSGVDKEYTKILKCGIKNKKSSTVKKFDGIVSLSYYKGSIAICHGYCETNYLGQKLSVYNCKKKSYTVVTKNATRPVLVDGKWYYVTMDSKKNIYVMKCDLYGKNKKKVKKLPSDFMYFEKIGKKSITYYDHDDDLHTVKY